MKSSVASYIASLVVAISITLAIHLSILYFKKYALFENKIVLSYIINFVLALGIYLTLNVLKDKFKTQIGFLFIAGSLLKFLVFFIVFYPGFKRDGDISKLEFASFFIPYLVCLVIETIGVMKLLKKLD